MPSITVDNIKAHLSITGEQDDVVLADLIEASDDFILRYTGAYFAEGEEWPASLKQAVRLLVGHLYENREATLVGISADMLPLGFLDLVAPHRAWSFCYTEEDAT